MVGLSATVTRKDGHHPIVTMQCGPVRHRVDARAQAVSRPFAHIVLVQPTGFRSRRTPETDRRMDGAQHLSDPAAYRRDRRQDRVLQEHGYFVLRFLAEDVGRDLDTVLDAILRVLGRQAG